MKYTTKTMENINETKSLFFEKKSKINKLLLRLTKNKREKTILEGESKHYQRPENKAKQPYYYQTKYTLSTKNVFTRDKEE